MKGKVFFLYFFIFIFVIENAYLFALGGEEKYTTDINIDYVKDYLNSGDIDDEREGIYIQSNGDDNPYLLAIVKNMESNEFWAIYLSGPGGSDWQEGNIKAIFKQARNEFNGKWYSRAGINYDNARFGFDDDSTLWVRYGTFLITEYSFAKIYPYARGFARERGATGTGFLLNREGYVVTNYHVIDDAQYILVRGIGGYFSQAYPYIAVLTDEENDIAILEPEVSFLEFDDPPYDFITSEIPVGSSVFALGYPMRSAMGDEIKLTSGIISSQSGFRGSPNLYQTTASVSPGNSGGPLFGEKDGNLIGINSAYFPAANNVYYVVKIKYVLELIKNSPIQVKIPNNDPSRGIFHRSSNLAELTAEIKNFVYMIEAF